MRSQNDPLGCSLVCFALLRAAASWSTAPKGMHLDAGAAVAHGPVLNFLVVCAH